MPPTPTSVETAEGAFVDKGFFKTQYAAGGFNPNAKEFYPLQMPTPPLEEMAQEKLAQPSTAYGFAGGAHHTHAHHHHQTPSPVSSNGVVPAQGVAHVQSQGIHPQLHHDTDRAASPSKPHHPQMSLNVQPQHTHMHAMPSVVTYSPVTQQQPVSEPIHAQTFPEVIREVWRETLEEAMEDMSALVHDGYNCVGMDTEFPGVVARAPSSTTVNGVKGYASMWQTIRVNVNILKVIQIGMCFRDKDGKAPEDRPSTFQINFHFDLDKDIYAVDSISMLQNSGIEFDILKKRGCDVAKFAELLMSSGLVLEEEITWVTFGAGYDFAYLIRLLTSQEVPFEEREFLELVGMYFPSFYDTKYMARESSMQHSGGLEALATILDAARIGRAHQAGSDSLVTVNVFFKLLSVHYPDSDAPLGAIKNVLSGFEPSGSTTPPRTYDD